MLRQVDNDEPTDEFPVTAPQCFEIVSLTADRLELRDVETGEKLVFLRIN